MNRNVELLKDVIDIASQLEYDFPAVRLQLPIGIVGFGSLVRLHRLARLMLQIPEEFAYESLALIRCMVEVQVNLSWIRRDKLGDRASRFLAFEPLERLITLKEIPEMIPPGEALETVAKLEAQREAVRSLFAKQGSGSETLWAKTWASVPNLRARLDEIMKAEGNSKVPFTYVLYRWASTIVHGGPMSIVSILQSHRGNPVPRSQPLSDPTSVYAAAALSLLMTCSDVATIGELPIEQRKGISNMIKKVSVMFSHNQSQPRTS